MELANLPLEMINEICKHLNWQDVKNLETAYPSTKYSGAKMDVLNRTIPSIEKKINTILLEIEEIDEYLKLYSHEYFRWLIFDTYLFSVNEKLISLLFTMRYLKYKLSRKKIEINKVRKEYMDVTRWRLS